jgi:hypothetical protein
MKYWVYFDGEADTYSWEIVASEDWIGRRSYGTYREARRRLIRLRNLVQYWLGIGTLRRLDAEGFETFTEEEFVATGQKIYQEWIILGTMLNLRVEAKHLGLDPDRVVKIVREEPSSWKIVAGEALLENKLPASLLMALPKEPPPAVGQTWYPKDERRKTPVKIVRLDERNAYGTDGRQVSLSRLKTRYVQERHFR